jgi:hypothetical protein
MAHNSETRGTPAPSTPFSNCGLSKEEWQMATKMLAAAILLAAMTGTSFAAPMGGGTGNTGNRTNNPAAVQNEMMKHRSVKHRAAVNPWCTPRRTQNCRPHATMKKPRRHMARM